jgi:two-component system cell cycle sensor histidine kinase/response regulator CckA
MQKNVTYPDGFMPLRKEAQRLFYLGKGPGDRYRLIFVQECNHLIREVASILSRTCEGKVQFHTKLDEDLWPVKASAKKLQNILLEIAINSVEAVSEGGRVLFQTCNKQILDYRFLAQYKINQNLFSQFGIIDNGHGMSGYVKKNMFNRGFTGKSTLHHPGIGLMNVKKTITDYGGFIKIKTCEGIGTVFNIFLPASKITLPNRDISYQENRQQRNRTILLVDDEPAFQTTAASMLSRYGYKIIPAATATESKILFKIYYKKIDVIMLDLTLLGTDARRLIKFYEELNPKIKIIATYGLGEEDIYFGLSPYPFAGSIQKPYFYMPLIKTIKKALED